MGEVGWRGVGRLAVTFDPQSKQLPLSEPAVLASATRLLSTHPYYPNYTPRRQSLSLCNRSVGVGWGI